MAHLKQKEVRVGPNLKKMHNFDKVESDLCVTQIQAMTDRRQRRRGSATVKTGLTTSLTSPHVGSRLSGDLVRQSVWPDVGIKSIEDTAASDNLRASQDKSVALLIWSFGASSVTRLGYFSKFWWPFFWQKLPNHLGNFWAIFEKVTSKVKTAEANSWATFGKKIGLHFIQTSCHTGHTSYFQEKDKYYAKYLPKKV